MNEPERDDQAIRRFVERFAAALVEGGIPRMPARVFAALLVTDAGRLTSSGLADLLQVSPAAISGAVRYLGQVNLVRREREPGSRRDHYVVHDNAWYEASMNREQLLTEWVNRAKEGVEMLGPDTQAGRRMAETLMFFEFIREENPAMMERWREHRAKLQIEQDRTATRP